MTMLFSKGHFPLEHVVRVFEIPAAGQLLGCCEQGPGVLVLQPRLVILLPLGLGQAEVGGGVGQQRGVGQ